MKTIHILIPEEIGDAISVTCMGTEFDASLNVAAKVFDISNVDEETFVVEAPTRKED